MDLWVVAAAAGAGYVAKNLQNLSVDKRENLGGSSLKYSYNVQSQSRNFLQQLRDKTCPLRRLAQQGVEDNSFLDVENESDVVGFLRTDGLSRDGGSLEQGLKFEDGGNGSLGGVKGEKLIRERRCVHSTMRPLNSNMEHGTFSVRPVLVTDGRWGCGSSHKDFDGCRDGVMRGSTVSSSSSSSSSKRLESVEDVSRETRSARLQGKETMLLFITGMSIGILSATWSWKNEVDMLNKKLKQMDSLVQDLHEELDMKEMIMVKELTDEGDLSSQEKHTPSSPPADNVDRLNKLYSHRQTSEKGVENLELLSRIEEELQAELEMLEQNMMVSAMERISSVVEIDPDFEPEIALGDLKPKMANDASKSGNETSGSTTNCSKPANYAVSPRELSLRLHELIESRLEARIKELEIALGNSQNMVSGRRLYNEPNGLLPRVVDEEEKEDGEYDSFSQHGVIMEEHRPETLLQDIEQIQDKQRSTSFLYREDSTSEDEGSDESDLLLIKRIVERRKSGSNFNFKMD